MLQVGREYNLAAIMAGIIVVLVVQVVEEQQWHRRTQAGGPDLGHTWRQFGANLDSTPGTTTSSVLDIYPECGQNDLKLQPQVHARLAVVHRIGTTGGLSNNPGPRRMRYLNAPIFLPGTSRT